MSLSLDEAEELELLELEEMEAASQSPKPGMLESALRGSNQGVSAGFGDEIAGRVAQATDWAQGMFGESPVEMAARMKSEGVKIPRGIPSSRDELYTQVRDEERSADRAAQQANPWTFGAGGLTGGLAMNAVPGLGLAKGAGLGKTVGNAALQGAAYGAGGSEEESVGGIARDAAVGGAVGGVLGGAIKGGGDALAPYAAKAGDAIGNVGNKLRGVAEDFAVKATGATGKQAGTFADDAGRQLLDRRLVRFGDSPEAIAGRVGEAVDDAGRNIGRILDDLDAKGVEASVDNVVAAVESQIRDLGQTPGNEKVIRQLRKTVDELYARGQSNVPVSMGEKAKRTYQGQTNYFSPEADKTASGIAARAFKEESERAATAANPIAGKAFQEEKQAFGLLKPIQEAAEKRASTLNQSPIGGLGDIATEAVTGGSSLGMAAMARRAVAPRLSSTIAISTDAIANLARQAPERLGKFAPVIQNAAQRGSQAVAATNFVLQQSNQEYRELMRKMQEEDGTNQ